MAKPRRLFACAECGAEHRHWMGQCSVCGVWNSLTARRVTEGPGSLPSGAFEPGAQVIVDLDGDDVAITSREPVEA